jgi:1-aminocyclopropane-1-carboxylate deaminase/D-cysteine desulfhydrase-like pyridoxal-dependent ACC family enzyme
MGHALAADELLVQLGASGEERATVVLATATGGTQAGMLVGIHGSQLRTDVIGFAVAKSAEELASDVSSLAAELVAMFNIDGPDSPSVVVDGRALGEGYGATTPEARTAIKKLARCEGILADPVYTGKALAGLLALIRENRFESAEAVVFVHTGGVPALFS